MNTDSNKKTESVAPATRTPSTGHSAGTAPVEPDAPAKQRSADLPAQPPPRAFGRAFWMCNVIEMFERLAYFGIRAVVPIYIMQATEPGGLHLTALHKGWIYMWWAVIQSWFPMVTGGFADRYGYKRVLVFAISTNVVGYLMMAAFHNYYGFFAGILVLAAGTAFFKPALQGTIAQNLTKATSSMGWGIFYWVVNVGAVMAPVIATVILGKPHSAEGWRNLFLASAAYTSVNLLVLLTFKDVPSGADKSQGWLKVLGRTIENIWPFWFVGGQLHPVRGPVGLSCVVVGLALIIGWSDSLWHAGVALFLAGGLLATWLRDGAFQWQVRLPIFLGIMSCFWMMMYQLWDLHPNFIEDWVDSSMVAAWAPFDAWREYGDRGLVRVPQQILLNLNAFLIVLLIVPISWLVRKMRTLSAMLIGMSVATIGILVAGLTGNGWVFLLGVVFFSLGEMLTGPKKNEYLGLIAPPGKKGLYLGYVNIPVGVGVGLGSMIAGVVYDNFGEKATLALKYLGAHQELVARAAQASDWSDSLHLLPGLLDIDRGDVLAVAATALGEDEASAAQSLRAAYRNDEGQIINLGLTYLALQPESQASVSVGLASRLAERAEDKRAQQVAHALAASTQTLEQIGVARFVDVLPDVLGVRRPQVMEVLRDRVNRDFPADQKKDDAEIVSLLWERFGHDAETLNNLALEYLAQGTDRASKAAAAMDFKRPVEQIEAKLGIGRTKAFEALTRAMGADEPAVESALEPYADSVPAESQRAYVYLIERKHHRFRAVGRRDWNNDRSLLRDLIELDADAKAVIAARLGDPADIDFRIVADDQPLIQEALDAKDWKTSPGLAAYLLGVNPLEARAMVAAEVNDAALVATATLWNRYHPQYLVWLPFAAIGVLAAIALAIFGRMAKRWADMNA